MVNTQMATGPTKENEGGKEFGNKGLRTCALRSERMQETAKIFFTSSLSLLFSSFPYLIISFIHKFQSYNLTHIFLTMPLPSLDVFFLFPAHLGTFLS